MDKTMMAMDISPAPLAIRVENLGKFYRIGAPQTTYRTLRDAITDTLKAPFQKLCGIHNFPEGSRPATTNTIWALKDVSLEIAQGEILGIIGRNGAGKTTLLKVLSRITEPTEGRVEIRGRIGSLLEVGTGFHHELTGRENIFLNGAILGMTRREIQQKFDEIVEFAGIGSFLDTPLKRYSTGMGTRLAFAIAAHLDTEILLVDEVLAVGDIGFRKKCLGKMQDVTQVGRTLLFVSHDMNAIRRLCRSAVWLDEGRIRAAGCVQEVVDQYEAFFLNPERPRIPRVERRDPPPASKYFSWVSLVNQEGKPTTKFNHGDTLCLTVGMSGQSLHTNHYVEWYLTDVQHDRRVSFGASYALLDEEVPGETPEIILEIGPLPLTEGIYAIALAMGVMGVVNLDFWHNAIIFEVNNASPHATGYHYTSLYSPIIISYRIIDLHSDSK